MRRATGATGSPTAKSRYPLRRKGVRCIPPGPAGDAAVDKNRDPLSTSHPPIFPKGAPSPDTPAPGSHPVVDFDGSHLRTGDLVRVVERGPDAIVREVLAVGETEHVLGYVKVSGILGFAHGRRFRKVRP